MNEHHDVIRKVYVNNKITTTTTTPIKISQNTHHSSKNKTKKQIQNHLQSDPSTLINISPQKQLENRQNLLLIPLVVQPVALRKRPLPLIAPLKPAVSFPIVPSESQTVMLSNKQIITSNPNQQNHATKTTTKTTTTTTTTTIPQRPSSPKYAEEYPAQTLAPMSYLRQNSTHTNPQNSNSKYLIEGSMSFKEQQLNQLNQPSAVFYNHYTNTTIPNKYPSQDSPYDTKSTSSSSSLNTAPLLRILQNRFNRVTSSNSSNNNNKSKSSLSDQDPRNSYQLQYISLMNRNNPSKQQRSFSGAASQIQMNNSNYSFGSSSSDRDRCNTSSLQATPQQYFYDQQFNTPIQYQLKPKQHGIRFPINYSKSRNRILTSPNDRQTIVRQQNLNSSFAQLRIANTTAAFSTSPFDSSKQSSDQIRTTNPNERHQRVIATKSIMEASNSSQTIQSLEQNTTAPNYIPREEPQKPSADTLEVQSRINYHQNTSSTIEGSLQLTKPQLLTTSNTSRTTGALVLPQIQLIFIDDILSNNNPQNPIQSSSPQFDSLQQSIALAKAVLKRKNQLRINLEKHILSLLHESVQQIVDFDFLQRIHPYIKEIIISEPYLRSQEHPLVTSSTLSQQQSSPIPISSGFGQSGSNNKYTLAEVSKWTLLKQLQQYESGQLGQKAFFGFIMNYFLPPFSYRQHVVKVLLESINETLIYRSIQLPRVLSPITQLFDIQGNPIHDLYQLDLNSTILLASSLFSSTSTTPSVVAVAAAGVTAASATFQLSAPTDFHLTEQIKQKLHTLHLAYQKKHASNYKQAKVQSSFVVATNDASATREASKTMKLPEILLKNNPAFQFTSLEVQAKKRR